MFRELLLECTSGSPKNDVTHIKNNNRNGNSKIVFEKFEEKCDKRKRFYHIRSDRFGRNLSENRNEKEDQVEDRHLLDSD